MIKFSVLQKCTKLTIRKMILNFIPKDTDRLLLRHGRCKSFWSETEWTFSGLYVLAFITCSGIIIPGIKLKSWWISLEINSRKLKGAADSQTWLNTCMSTVINSQWSAAQPRRISPNCQTKLEFQPKQAGILGENIGFLTLLGVWWCWGACAATKTVPGYYLWPRYSMKLEYIMISRFSIE